MTSSLGQLEVRVDTQALQVIQDDIAAVTDMAVLTVDHTGKPVTRHSRCTDFCKAMRSATSSSRLCETCDFHGGHKAQSMQRPYVYKCHMGIIDVAVPLVADRQYLGSIMLGQVSTPKQEQMDGLERLLASSGSRKGAELQGELEHHYQSLPVMPMERIQAIAGLVTHMSDYLIGNIRKTYVFGAGTLQAEQKQEKNRAPLSKAKTISPLAAERASVRLKPALEHIREHFRLPLKLAEMAALCWVSGSYFSKLFRQVTGRSFPAYLNQLRVEEAERILQNSNETIVSIALSLGYEDCGYFIRVFKKSTGVTPAAYRSGRI